MYTEFLYLPTVLIIAIYISSEELGRGDTSATSLQVIAGVNIKRVFIQVIILFYSLSAITAMMFPADAMIMFWLRG